jgi:hypothetical protein
MAKGKSASGESKKLTFGKRKKAKLRRAEVLRINQLKNM